MSDGKQVKFTVLVFRAPDFSLTSFHSFTRELYFLSFLSTHRAQQARSGWPSDVIGGSVVGNSSTCGI